MKFRFLATDFAIDLGSSNILVYKKNEGIIANEPSVIVLDDNSSKVLAVGDEAKEMIGKTNQSFQVVKPVVNGAITNFNLTEALLNYFFKKVNEGMSVLQAKSIITTSLSITDIQARAIEDAALHAGSRDIILIDQSLASAYGMGLDADKSSGILLLNLGAGVSEVSVIALNSVIAYKSVNKGGDYIDQLIIDYLKENHSLEVGENTAEYIKNELASLRVKDKDNSLSIDGKDILSAKPKSITLKSSDLIDCILPYSDMIIDMIYEVLEKCPPELTSDIKKKGIALTGGVSKLKGMSDAIKNKTNLNIIQSEDPLTDAIRGAGIILEDLSRYDKYRK